MTYDGALLPIAGKQYGDNYTFLVPNSECSSVI